MEVAELKEKWAVSEYNENTEDQLDYYINEARCEVGDSAYIYRHDDNTLTELKIQHIIKRTNNIEKYDELIKDDSILLDGEERFSSDTSAEFITNSDCYLVWFTYK